MARLRGEGLEPDGTVKQGNRSRVIQGKLGLVLAIRLGVVADIECGLVSLYFNLVDSLAVEQLVNLKRTVDDRMGVPAGGPGFDRSQRLIITEN